MNQNANKEPQAPQTSSTVKSKQPAKKAPFVHLLTNKNGRKMTKAEKQMAGSVVVVCILVAILIVAVKALA